MEKEDFGDIPENEQSHKHFDKFKKLYRNQKVGSKTCFMPCLTLTNNI